MANHFDYNRRSTWEYPETLIQDIKKNITLFFKDNDHQFENFTILTTYESLRTKIVNDTSIAIPLRWLKDFYKNQKDGNALSKTRFEALMRSFNYDYDPIKHTFRKKNFSPPNKIQNEDIFLFQKDEITTYLNSKRKVNKQVLNIFVGKYKYFLGARKNSIYDYIYENELEILETGEVKIFNPFSNQNYVGNFYSRNEKTIQILSFDYNDGLIEGIGNLVTFKVNLYGNRAILIPGISLSFDADLRPISSQALLCSDLAITKKSKPIREYFDKIIKQLRLSCPEIDETERLRNKYFKGRA